MPKCEIFDRSDFPDFYTIKSSWVGDLEVKKNSQHFRVHLGVQSSLILTRMLSLFLRRFFLSLGQKNIFPVELLRPLVSVNNDFFKFFISEVLIRAIENLTLGHL